MSRKIKGATAIKAKDLVLCVSSAILLILSFPKFNLGFLAWFGFVPVFFALNNKSRKEAFFLFFITGAIFWSGIIYWLAHVTLAGAIVLILYLALYFAIFGMIIRPSTKHSTPYILLFIPSVWVLLEFIRSHLLTGFPWALLGYSQYLSLPFIQIADITGVWGVSFLIMMVNAAVYSIFRCQMPIASKIRKFLPFILIVIIALSYGYYKLNYPLSAIRYPLFRVSVIQGNISQELKWDKNSREFIMERYFSLSGEALKDKPDLIIWPEAALPVTLEEEPSYFERVKGFIKETKIPLLLGAVTLRDNHYATPLENPALKGGDEGGFSPSGLHYNSALLVSGQGELLGIYDKLHLVPFGEYIPLRKALSFLETIAPIGDFSRGRHYTVFNLPITDYRLPITFSVLICFEDLFPKLSREFVKRGAGFLVNITNDAWFQKTSAPYQHLSASVFRAVENRISLVRSANTGVSGFIAPTGKIISLVGDEFGYNIFISGYKSSEILPGAQEGLGFYTRYGDIFVCVCLLFVLGGIIILKKSQ